MRNAGENQDRRTFVADSIKNIQYASFTKGSRFFELAIEKDLFEFFTVVRVNGSLNSRQCQFRYDAFTSIKDAKSHLEKLFLYRINNRKYNLIDIKLFH